MRRSARNGEMKATSTIRPASAISLATSADAADVLHAVGVGEAQIRFRPWRTLSPSSRKVWRPSANSFFSTRLAMVDLPAPRKAGEPEHAGCWRFSAARASRSMSSACQ